MRAVAIPADLMESCRRRWQDFRVERVEVDGQIVLSASGTRDGTPEELSVAIPHRTGGEPWAVAFLVEGLRQTLRRAA